MKLHHHPFLSPLPIPLSFYRVDWTLIAPSPVFIEGGFSAIDIRQGEVGDCYLLAAAASLCETPEVLDSIFVTAEANPEGVYCLRFWVDNAWTWIITDSRFLVLKDAHHTMNEFNSIWQGRPDIHAGTYAPFIGAHCGNPNEFWLAFLEKAWAKLNGTYSSISAGTPTDALLAFLPHAASQTSFQFPNHNLIASDHDGLDRFAKISHWLERGWPVCLGSLPPPAEGEGGGQHGGVDGLVGDGHGGVSQDSGAVKDGIIRGHAFTAVRTCRVPLAIEPRGYLDLIQLRNPWGTGEWLLRASDSDKKFWTPKMIEFVRYDPVQGGDDGTFWMPFEELHGRFSSASTVRKVKLINDGGTWTKKTVLGSWTHEMTIKFMSDYATKGFEQYVLEPSATGRFIIQLNQLPISGVHAENHLANVDCAIFSVLRGPHSTNTGPLLQGDDFKKYQDTDGAVILPAATRIDQRIASAVEDEQESIALDGGNGKVYSLIPYYLGELYANSRGFNLTVISDTPFTLHKIVNGKISNSGVISWSGSGAFQKKSVTVIEPLAKSLSAKVSPSQTTPAPPTAASHHNNEDNEPYPGERGGGCCCSVA